MMSDVVAEAPTLSLSSPNHDVGAVKRWLSTLGGKLRPLLPCDFTDGAVCKLVSSPSGPETIAVGVVLAKEDVRAGLQRAWSSTDALSSPAAFLDTWASALEADARLIALTEAAFSDSAVSELPLAVSELRYWAGQAPGAVESPASPSLSDCAHIRLREASTALLLVCRAVGLLLSSRARHVLISTPPDSPASVIVHKAVSLAGRKFLAWLPLPDAEESWCGLVGLPDGPGRLSAATSGLWAAMGGTARTCLVVMSSADLFMAAEAAVTACGDLHLVLVHEACWDRFLELLRERLNHRLSYHDVKEGKLHEALQAETRDGAKITKHNGLALVTGAQPAGPLARLDSQHGLDGACLYAIPFRTAKEALKLANHAPRRRLALLWTEAPAEAAQMAEELSFKQVTVNCVAARAPHLGATLGETRWRWRGSGKAVGERPKAEGEVGSAGKPPSDAWEKCGAAQRRRALRPVAEKAGEVAMDVVRGAEEWTAARQWSVTDADFQGHVTVQHKPAGVVLVVVEDGLLAPDRLLHLLLRVLLLGDRAVVATGPSLSAHLRSLGLHSVPAVRLADLSAMIAEARQSAAVLYALEEAAEKRLVHACMPRGPRLLCVADWTCLGGQWETEMLREMCTNPKAVWTYAFHSFAN